MKVNSRDVQSNNHQEDGDGFDIKSAILRYFSHWPFFLSSISIAILTAFVVNQCAPPVYKIQSKFLIKEDNYSIDVFQKDGGKNTASPKGQKIANESIIIKSRSTAEDVLDRLPFDVEYYEDGVFNDTELYAESPISVEVDWDHLQLTNGKIRISWDNHQSFRMTFLEKEYQQYDPEGKKVEMTAPPELLQGHFTFGEWVQFPQGKFVVNLTGPAQTGSIIIRIRDRESLIRQYTGDNLQVLSADKMSSILTLTLDTRQPYKGRDYLNMLMTVFLANELDEKNTIASNTIHFIDSQLSGLSDSLNYAENKLETYRSSNRTYNITSEGNTLFEQLQELEKTLSQEKFKYEYLQSLQQYVSREQYSEILIPSGLGIEDALLNKLIQDLVGYQADRSRFLASQTESSPAVIEVTRKIKNLNLSIIEAIGNVTHRTNLVISDLSRRISKIEKEFGKLPQTERDLLTMKRRYTLNESIYTFLLQRRAEASIILASNAPSNKIIEEAVLNLEPMRLRPMLNYFLATILGFLIPLTVLFLRNVFAVKIQDLKEVEHSLSAPIIGCIGRNRRPSPLVVLKHCRARMTEAFRALRTNIDFLMPTDRQLTILFTSSVAGEGKSFCSVNLASVYSACDKKTILVRCDLHKSFSFDGLGIPNTIGLSNYLTGQVDQLDLIIQKSEHAYLDVIVPGPVPPSPAELLIGDRFRNLLLELKNRYQVVVLDSSPLGLTNETLYVTRMADVTIFLLRYNYSNKVFIENINRLKEQKNLKDLYVLINDVPDKDLNYEGNGYGYYDDDETISPYRKIANFVSRRAAI